MKILNLYAGIGGNRKLWGKEHQITAVERNKEIANLYKKYYPNDVVIVEDAHEYLLNHINEFGFIWGSPPCPSHSRLKEELIKIKRVPMEYPEMSLYQEIILLKYFCKVPWVIENVIGYYPPLIKPQAIIGRHQIWSNFYIRTKTFKEERIAINNMNGSSTNYGFNIKSESIKTHRKDGIIRNLVNPEIGKYLFEQAQIGKQPMFNFNY